MPRLPTPPLPGGWLRPTAAWCCALALVLATATGCRLAGRGSPVPQSLLSCRQLTQRGISAIDAGDWTRAEGCFAQAVKACPVDVDARCNYAETLWQRGARQDAYAQMQEAARLAPDDAELLVRQAEMQCALGQSEAALRGIRRTLDLDPNQARAWAVRGRAARDQGDLRQALSDYHRALALAPDDRELLLEVARLYQQLNRPQRSLAYLQSLLDTYAEGEEPQQGLFLAGLAYRALGRHDDAVASLTAARAAGDPSAELLYQLAAAEWEAGRLPQADAAAREALALEPEHPACRSLLERIAQVQPSDRLGSTR